MHLFSILIFAVFFFFGKFYQKKTPQKPDVLFFLIKFGHKRKRHAHFFSCLRKNKVHSIEKETKKHNHRGGTENLWKDEQKPQQSGTQHIHNLDTLPPLGTAPQLPFQTTHILPPQPHPDIPLLARALPLCSLRFPVESDSFLYVV